MIVLVELYHCLCRPYGKTFNFGQNICVLQLEKIGIRRFWRCWPRYPLLVWSEDPSIPWNIPEAGTSKSPTPCDVNSVVCFLFVLHNPKSVILTLPWWNKIFWGFIVNYLVGQLMQIPDRWCHLPDDQLGLLLRYPPMPPQIVTQIRPLTIL